MTRTILVSTDVESYLVALVRATRAHDDLRLGHHRAAAWRSTARAGGPSWTAVASSCRTTSGMSPHPVLEHRLLLDIDRELRGATVKGVIDAVLEAVPVPLCRRLRLGTQTDGWLAGAGGADDPGR
jgi:MoxR-like ATPase